MKEKIIVVVDSGSDLNPKLIDDLPILVLPLQIIVDGVAKNNLTQEDVRDVIDTSQISTSLPKGEVITQEFLRLKDEGYTHIIAITIFSGLSGTYNVMSVLGNDVEGITVHTVDTLNISIACGLYALEVAQKVHNGQSFDEIVSQLEAMKKASKVFFTVGSLEYLRRGGRIGLVAGTIANVLNIKPVISCNEDGVYYTVKKIRGYHKTTRVLIDAAAEFASRAESCRVAILEAFGPENRSEIMEYVKEKFPHARRIDVTNVSPALMIHTGPEAFGIGVFCDL